MKVELNSIAVLDVVFDAAVDAQLAVAKLARQLNRIAEALVAEMLTRGLTNQVI